MGSSAIGAVAFEEQHDCMGVGREVEFPKDAGLIKIPRFGCFRLQNLFRKLVFADAGNFFFKREYFHTGEVDYHESPSQSRRLYRRNDLDAWKVALVSSGIPSQQSQVSNCCMCADVEVKQRRPAQTSSPAVPQKAFSSEKTGFPRKRFTLV